ncbi:hypothetical protein EU538_09045 [Candidatus Thorarchaeota archaeon]|nr:MAG: hypothetical protein EU538_09045 [Candidatus Thorarchaeota archaeon]
MFEIIGFGIVFAVLLILAAKCYGSGPSSGEVRITRPDPKKAEGFGGNRGYDYSYSGQGAHGYSKPFPVGLRKEREKTDTHKSGKREDAGQ